MREKASSGSHAGSQERRVQKEKQWFGEGYPEIGRLEETRKESRVGQGPWNQDTAIQGPWRKKAESKAEGMPGSGGFDDRTKVRADLKMLCLGGRKRESGQGSSGS